MLLCIIKLTAVLFHEPGGLTARYYANAEWEGQPETSWRHPGSAPATRIDPAINFYSKGYSLHGQVFPLYFANDWHRFKWHRDEERKRQRKLFAFSAIWQGYIVNDADYRDLVIEFEGGSAALALGERTAEQHGSSAAIKQLAPGVYPIAVKFAYPGESEKRSLRLYWRDFNGAMSVVSSHELSPEQSFPPRYLPYCFAALNLAFYGLIVFYIANCRTRLSFKQINKENCSLALLVLLGSSLMLIDRLDRAGNSWEQILPAGSDYLLYETQARNILQGDYLDRAPDNGPFGMNVLYRYLLAAMHLLLGENIVPVIWLQVSIMLAFACGFYKAVRHLYSKHIAAIALLHFALFPALFKFSKKPLDAIFTVIASTAALFLFIAWHRSKRYRLFLFGCIALALAIALRANLIPLAAVAGLWAVLVFEQRKFPKQSMPRLLFTLLPICAVPPLLIGLRNYLVAGEFILLPTTGAWNFWLGNRPPQPGGFQEFFRPQEGPADGDYMSAALAYIAAEPVAFAQRCLEKFLYILGWNGNEGEMEWKIAIPTMLAALAIVFHKALNMRSAEVALMAAWLLAIAAPLVVIFPWGYGWRLQAATIPITYLFSSVLVHHLWRRGYP